MRGTLGLFQGRRRTAVVGGGQRRGVVDEALALAVHGHLDVLQLVVAAQLQRREHRQTHPRRERAPRTELHQC
jgi:hypothetical protein